MNGQATAERAHVAPARWEAAVCAGLDNEARDWARTPVRTAPARRAPRAAQHARNPNNSYAGTTRCTVPAESGLDNFQYEICDARGTCTYGETFIRIS